MLCYAKAVHWVQAALISELIFIPGPCRSVILFFLSHSEYSGEDGSFVIDYNDVDYVVIDDISNGFVLLLRIYWDEQWYYVCEDSLTLNAVKAFCRNFLYVDGGMA